MTDDPNQAAGHSAMDYAEHERTYKMFTQGVKYTIAGVLLLLAALAFFLG
ncbi:MAG TPA: aa3-type cytochrome c oxidase subunit IV [Methylocella sp.]|nr:aa3-type cytochrome c oxidase subunit IV [Methylocella sp.]